MALRNGRLGQVGGGSRDEAEGSWAVGCLSSGRPLDQPALRRWAQSRGTQDKCASELSAWHPRARI